MGYIPLALVKETIRRTTQLATTTKRMPLRRHIKSRFSMLRRKRLNEVVATDTLFSDIASVEGYTCSQVFFGCSSRIVEVYGKKK